MITATRDTNRIRDRLAHGAALLLLATAFRRIVQVISALLLARLLTPQDYGLVSIALVVAYFLDTATNVQMGEALVRIDGISQAYLDTAFTLNLLRGVLSAGVIGLLAHPMAVIMHDHRLQSVLYMLTIPPLLIGLQNPYFSLFARNLNFGKISIREVFACLFAASAGIAVAVVYRSYWAIVVSSLAAEIVRLALSYWRIPGRPGLSLAKTREMLSFGSWITLVNIVDYVTWRLDYVMIGNRIGAAAVGVYQITNSLTTTVTLDMVGALTQTLLPAFSTISSDKERLRSGYKQAQTVAMALALPVGFGLSAVAPHLVPLLVGDKWMQAIMPVQILAPVIALQSMTGGIEALAYSLNKGRLIFIRGLVGLPVRAIFMIAGYLLGAFSGIVMARAVSGLVLFVYNLLLVERLTGLRVFKSLTSGWRSLAAALPMWLTVAIMPLPYARSGTIVEDAADVAVQVTSGAAIYAGLHLFLWLACGRPDGAEQRLFGQARRLAGAATRRWKSQILIGNMPL